MYHNRYFCSCGMWIMFLTTLLQLAQQTIQSGACMNAKCDPENFEGEAEFGQTCAVCDECFTHFRR